MKKVFLLLPLLALWLFASEKEMLQAQVLEKIFQNIAIKEEIVLWSDNKTVLEEIKKSGRFTTTHDCLKATLLILQEKKNFPEEMCKKAVFVLDYELLKEVPQSFGAMFWKKGRPNIVLIESRAQIYSIQISNGLKMYIEEKIW